MVGCGPVVARRIGVAWDKWKELSEVLCDKKVSTKHTVLLFRICILYGNETWSVTHGMEGGMNTAEIRHIFLDNLRGAH